jgi:outer membrane protein insertion porin family
MTYRKLIIYIKLIVIMAGIAYGIIGAPDHAIAQDDDKPVNVLILPFKIDADANSNYLRTQIPETIGTYLGRSGASIVPQKAAENLATTPGIEAFQAARRHAATHIISGRFSKVGTGFVLETVVTPTDRTLQPTVLKSEGRSIENLLNVLNKLTDDIGKKLFQDKIIADIRIKGNQRIESDAILRMIQSKIGSVFQPKQLSEDLRAIYGMGYFDDLRVDAQPDPKGKIITFHVKEKATIRRIKFKGNKHFNDDKLKENLTISTGSILNIYKIRNNIDLIVNLYKEDNYHQVKVDYSSRNLDNNQTDLQFIIDEGERLYITNVNFVGNQTFTDKQLKKEISTSPKGFFYWLTSSGDLDKATLDQDVARLNAFYHNKGYIRARIGDPQIDILEDEIHVAIKIDEGPRFKVGGIDVSGDLIFPKETLLKQLHIGDEDYFNREKLQHDVIALTDLYGDEGYAYADVAPQVIENKEQLLVDVTYRIQKKQQVYFEDIFITGNTRTRDKVIRRELWVHEQEMFSGKALKRSIRNLYRLDYFEDIKVKTLRGDDDDKMVLNIDVKEKPTGNFSFGAGFSSEENLFLLGGVSMRNFLGRGQTLKFNGQIGAATTRFTFSFTEPWLFDTHLSFTGLLYNQEKDYDEYDVNSMGGGVRFSYPIFDYTRFYWGYTYDISEVDDIDDDAADTIWELEGRNATSSVSIGVGYDSRDRTFNTTEGSKHSINFEYAGLGGDIGFNKTKVETGWYFPLYKGVVGFIHGKAGVVLENSKDKLLPDYEKFYLGGINSLRGFDYRGVHLTEINEKGEESKVGGELMTQLNFELIIPLYSKMGFMGVVFYDTGNVYEDQIDLGDLRSSWGYGIRWYSPIAPIRIEYGNIIDPRDDEEDGRWEFTLGGAF